MLKKLILPILATMVLAGNAFAADFSGTFENLRSPLATFQRTLHLLLPSALALLTQ